MSRRARRLVACATATWGCFLAASAPAGAVTLPAGFHQTAVFTGLTMPTAVRPAPAPDTRVFVAEKSGVIRVYDSPADTTPTTAADLRTETLNWWDRGLLGLAVDPDFPTRPYVYALYTRDALPGGSSPQWGQANQDFDDCDSVGVDDCIATGRLVRITLDTTTNTQTAITTLVTDWCQQAPSHSVGDLQFGADKKLYASSGDGASFYFADYGQTGNPCGDPPGAAGTNLTPPTGEGGALRSQDLRTSGDPTGLDGAIIRVDPDTGLAAAGNPLTGPDENARRIVGHGLRNPFRFAIRPGTNDLYIGDVGWNKWEEINRLASPATGPPPNFGWPCYEGDGQPGSGRADAYDGLDLTLCENLYGLGESAVAAPLLGYDHGAALDLCGPGGASVSGVAFPSAGQFPAEYQGGLFFADYSRQCIWYMGTTAGDPDPAKVSTFAQFDPGENFPVDLQAGPGGDLWYADIVNGSIWAIQHNGNPNAVAKADVTESLAAPLTVNFDATDSTDSDGNYPLTYEWDLDGDGQYDDSTAATPSFTYTATGTYQVRVRVTDSTGASSVSNLLTITPGNTKPTVNIVTPSAGLNWSVDDTISFSGAATDVQDGGAVTAAQMSWSVVVRHCPSDCHAHFLTSRPGVDAGSFVAPDHEYPSYLTLTLTATDADGLSASKSIDLQPATVQLTLATDPAGRAATLNSTSAAAPITGTVIRGSTNALTVGSPQTEGGRTFLFDAWSDGLAQTHQLVPLADATVTASFNSTPYAPDPTVAGEATPGATLTATEGSWEGTAPLTYTRTWQRCDADGQGCSDVAGSGAATYVLGPGDLGHRMRYSTSGQNAFGSHTARSAATATVAAPAPAPAPVPVPAPPGGEPPGPGISPPPVAAGLDVIERTVVRRHPIVANRDGTVTLRVSCARASACAGTLTLETAGSPATATDTALERLGRRRVGLRAHSAKRVRLRLLPAARRLLERRRSLRVRSVVELHMARGRDERVTTLFTLRAP